MYMIGYRQGLEDAIASELSWYMQHPCKSRQASSVVDEVITMLIISGETPLALATASQFQVRPCDRKAGVRVCMC